MDLGITGRDQVAERESSLPEGQDSGVLEVLDLGFGKCKLQVQVPEKGDINEAEQLVGKHVATSFTGLAEAFFKQLESARGQDAAMEEKPRVRTRITYVGGSVETACALGVADGIVDLVGKFCRQGPHL